MRALWWSLVLVFLSGVALGAGVTLLILRAYAARLIHMLDYLHDTR